MRAIRGFLSRYGKLAAITAALILVAGVVLVAVHHHADGRADTGAHANCAVCSFAHAPHAVAVLAARLATPTIAFAQAPTPSPARPGQAAPRTFDGRAPPSA